ncbi:MAG TPA: DUF881 domain-containing protein [Jatrophihabitans sp.]|nr:DUF881 domain-containing protein [Jatrophihabitans sp.]
MAQGSMSPRRWRILVPVVCLLAGLGFAAAVRESGGTALRAPVNSTLADTVRVAEDRVHRLDRQVRQLQAEVTRTAKDAGLGNSAVSRAQARVMPLLAPAGLTAVAGPGLEVILDDAPGPPAGVNVDPNQLVVHQSDLQAVVNALWAGGAEAMAVAGQRIIPTSAVRCVGNTLLLNGEVFSPPYRVAAIGPSGTMQTKLAASPGVKLFREAAGYYGLGYTVSTQDNMTLPEYSGPITLSYAHAGK